MIDVTTYGADKTGTYDSTTAIQTAMNHLPLRSGVLYFPSGIYLVTNQLNLSGRADVTIQGAGATLMLGQNPAPSIKGEKQVLQASNCDTLHIYGLQFRDMTRTAQYTGINIKNCTDVVLQHVSANGFLWTGISVYSAVPGGSDVVLVDGCKASNNRFGISVNSHHTRITNCFVAGPHLGESEGYYDGILVLKGSQGTVVANNTIVEVGAAGIYTQACRDLTVVGNTVTGCLARGIELDGDPSTNGGDMLRVVGASIVANVVTDCRGDINLVHASQVVVTGNRVANNDPASDCTGIAANIGVSDVLITGNHVRQAHPDRPAIWVHEGATGVTVTNNVESY